MHAKLTVTVLWTGTAVTDWVASTHILDAALAYPVVVAVATSVVGTVPVCVENTSVTVTHLLAVASVAGMEAFASPYSTVITRPVIATLTGVEVGPFGIWHTNVAVGFQWAVAGAADWVTVVKPDATVITVPEWLTDTIPVLVALGVVCALNALVWIGTGASVTLRIAGSPICLKLTVIPSPVWQTLTNVLVVEHGL